MRTVLVFIVFAFASCVQAEEATGRVRAIYYQAGRGVLMDARLAFRPSAIRWADVELAGRSVLVQMPAKLNAGVGDLVAVRLAEPKSSQLAQILPTVAVNRAIEIAPESPRFADRPEPNASTGR